MLIRVALFYTDRKYMIIPIESLLYVVTGFVVTYISLEVGWHFTACKIKTTNEKMIKPCLFKQVKRVLVAVPNART